MNSTPSLTLLAATALLATAPAWAASLYTLPAATPALETDTSVTANFGASAGAGVVDFTVAGYRTLDGDNQWIDVLHVTLNGSEVFSGTWNLGDGGGGTDRVLFNPNGATVGTVASQQLTISIPVTLAAGSNQLVLTYASPTSFEGTSRSGFQGLIDEGWGLNALAVSGPAPVPEPASGALLLAGLGVFGWLAKRRR
ncbi:PEP-CTERM sorting domain-containing protein [Roseateles sp. P5_E7]